MKCPKCSKELEPSAKFCMECGTKTENRQAEQPEEKVFSLQSWKHDKDRKKDENMKAARVGSKEKLKKIEDRMYSQQDEFNPNSVKKKEEDEEEEN